MPEISRREFMKLAGIGAAVSTLLVGTRPAWTSARSQAKAWMTDHTLSSFSTSVATTCAGCPAGCGLVVHTRDGRPYQVEGNRDHPVNYGSICSRGRASLESLYASNRVQGPVTKAGDRMDWESAIRVVQNAFENYAPDEIAFLLGLFPDHLHDLARIVSQSLGGFRVYRFEALGEFEAQVTLMDAAKKLFGLAKIPYFDLHGADVIFSFGANFTETWLSPAGFPNPNWIEGRGRSGQGGYLVYFEAGRSQAGALADEYIPINPGSEAMLARALGHLVGEIVSGAAPADSSRIDVNHAAELIGLPVGELERLAHVFAQASRKLAVPGGLPLGRANGLAAAEAILGLNIAAGSLGKESGLFLVPDSPLYPGASKRPNTIAEMGALCEQMKAGKIKVLLVHGANPVHDLPEVYGFRAALHNVELVISFASTANETAREADYIFPDHLSLESWGYQKISSGCDRQAISGLHPVVDPICDTRATADVLMAAAQALGGELASRLYYQDEVDFIRRSIAVLGDPGGVDVDLDPALFWDLWRGHGGWWKGEPSLLPPVVCQDRGSNLASNKVHFSGDEEEYQLHLLPFLYPGKEGKSQARPQFLQANSDLESIQSVEKTWVEVNPQTARRLGVRAGDVVEIISPNAEIEAVVSESMGVQPGIAAVPFRQGIKGESANVLKLLGREQNESGNLAFMGTRVKIISREET